MGATITYARTESMKHGRYSQRDYQYVLECRVPSPPSELKSSVVSDEDEDEMEEEELENPTALVEELSEPTSGGAASEPGVEVIRCVGDDVVAMEFVLPGERAEPFPGHEVEVLSARDGRCLLRVGDDEAHVVLRDGSGDELIEDGVLDNRRELAVPRGAQATITVGERFIIVRPVGLEAQRPHRKLKTTLAIIGLVIAGLAIMAIAVSFLQWSIEL